MILIPIVLALLALWVWSMMRKPSRRAVEIFNARGTAPREMTDRDCAYVLDFYRKFGGGEFRLGQIDGQELDSAIARRFGVEPGRLDDPETLGVRLPKLNLLVSFEPGRYRLTEEARAMAEGLNRTNESLENA